VVGKYADKLYAVGLVTPGSKKHFTKIVDREILFTQAMASLTELVFVGGRSAAIRGTYQLAGHCQYFQRVNADESFSFSKCVPIPLRKLDKD